MADQTTQVRLREGIDAARRGDKLAARRLLQQVLIADRNNELALMWMASVVDSLNERRAYLERALQINPNNARAREALRQLGVEPATSGRRAATSTGTAAAARSSADANATGGSNLYLIAAAFVAVIVIGVIIAAALNGAQTPQPQPEAAQSTFTAALNPTESSTPDTRQPTETPLPGVIVTFDPNAVTPLPPTFTLTPSRTPSPTPFPSLTPLPPQALRVVYTDFDPQAAQPSLFTGSAGGTGEVRVGSGDQGFFDVALDPTGAQIAFVREVIYEGEGGAVSDGEASGESEEAEEGGEGDVGEESSEVRDLTARELFVAPLDDPQAAIQLTELRGSRMSRPSWSPDGSQISFSSDSDGDEEIYVINADGSGLGQLTNNESIDTSPQFSPDGALIIFASDVESPGFTEIYTMTANGTQITRLTDHAGNSFAPTYSPDGTRIAYLNDRGGDGDVYIMDADGQRPFLLTFDDAGAEDRAPMWSPHGEWIAFLSNREDDAFRWFAVDLQGNVSPLLPPLDRTPQSLSFFPIER